MRLNSSTTTAIRSLVIYQSSRHSATTAPLRSRGPTLYLDRRTGLYHRPRSLRPGNPRRHSLGHHLATTSPGQREPVSDLPRSASHQRPRLAVIRWCRSGDRKCRSSCFGTFRLWHSAMRLLPAFWSCCSIVSDAYIQVPVSVIRTCR